MDYHFALPKPELFSSQLSRWYLRLIKHGLALWRTRNLKLHEPLDCSIESDSTDSYCTPASQITDISIASLFKILKSPGTPTRFRRAKLSGTPVQSTILCSFMNRPATPSHTISPLTAPMHDRNLTTIPSSALSGEDTEKTLYLEPDCTASLYLDPSGSSNNSHRSSRDSMTQDLTKILTNDAPSSRPHHWPHGIDFCPIPSCLCSEKSDIIPTEYDTPHFPNEYTLTLSQLHTLHD